MGKGGTGGCCRKGGGCDGGLRLRLCGTSRSAADDVNRGQRSDYSLWKENLFALRGKLKMAVHLRQNLCRQDRFFAAFDEFSTNCAENRLLHAALCRVLAWMASQAHSQLA